MGQPGRKAEHARCEEEELEGVSPDDRKEAARHSQDKGSGGGCGQARQIRCPKHGAQEFTRGDHLGAGQEHHVPNDEKGDQWPGGATVALLHAVRDGRPSKPPDGACQGQEKEQRGHCRQADDPIGAQPAPEGFVRRDEKRSRPNPRCDERKRHARRAHLPRAEKERVESGQLVAEPQACDGQNRPINGHGGQESEGHARPL